MNILFLSTRYPFPPDCGHYLRTYHTLKHLSRNNSIFFLSFLEKPVPTIHPEMKELCESIDVFMLPEDESKIFLLLALMKNLFSSWPFVAQKYFDKRMAKCIKDILARNRIDAIHVDMLPLSRYVWHGLNIPTFLVEHNVEYLRFYRLAQSIKNPLLRWYFLMQAQKLKHFEKSALSKFKHVYAVSDEDASQLKNLEPSVKCTVSSNGVDIDFFTPQEHKNTAHKIIWTGGARELYNRKSIDFLVHEIMPLLLKQDSSVELDLIGDSVEQYFPGIKNMKGINFRGYVDDIRPYFREASIFVAPIFAGGGTKLKVLNAMSMGRVVITTSLGIEGIEAKPDIHYVRAETAADFANKICQLFKNPREIHEIGNAARQLVEEKYSWDAVLKSINYI